jgi:hypothetical protein
MDVSGRIKIGVDRRECPVPVVYGIQLRALVVQSETSSEKVVAEQMFGVKRLATILKSGPEPGGVAPAVSTRLVTRNPAPATVALGL